ncbi:MAG TPA: methylated-DNA--[protein]-cysteine S-methyltransferase [Phycisphaerae bacterium]|nr:methylated-DNA--[protein]-cysteine S-methyltransferase [Phycisphaerae bacterium]
MPTPRPMPALPKIAEMCRAMLARDESYDGVFFIAVKTTGIFCRPGCPARKPLPKNVEYFGSAREALLAGYRPCKRCRPLDANGLPPPWVRRLLAKVDANPTGRINDRDLRAIQIDPARARRFFNKNYGMTFQAYQRSRRMGLALAEVRRGADATTIGLNHGYESTSGFRDAFAKIFGAPPGKARAADCIVTSWLTSPIGPLLVGATSEGLCLLEFTDRRAIEKQIAVLRRRVDRPIIPGKNAHLARVEDELARYFDGRLTQFKTPLVISGSPFQEKVWRRLLEIPYGRTCSYDDMARDIGRPLARRAVGRANGDNRIAIVIPCHRVIRADGTLSGYGGGVWRKQFLLDLERRTGELSQR